MKMFQGEPLEGWGGVRSGVTVGGVVNRGNNAVMLKVVESH